jgi:hypothetical protein
MSWKTNHVLQTMPCIHISNGDQCPNPRRRFQSTRIREWSQTALPRPQLAPALEERRKSPRKRREWVGSLRTSRQSDLAFETTLTPPRHSCKKKSAALPCMRMWCWYVVGASHVSCCRRLSCLMSAYLLSPDVSASLGPLLPRCSCAPARRVGAAVML